MEKIGKLTIGRESFSMGSWRHHSSLSSPRCYAVLSLRTCPTCLTERYLLHNVTKLPLADLGGTGGAPPPSPKDPILSFSHTFLPKSAHVRGWCPPMARRPPQTGNPGTATTTNATDCWTG